MSIQLEQKYLDELRSIVQKHVNIKIWQAVIFGSRAQGTARKFSDIDLGFLGSMPLPDKTQTALWDELDDSDIPYVIDIVDLSQAQSTFRAVAEKHMISLG